MYSEIYFVCFFIFVTYICMNRDIQIYSRQQQINRKKQIPCTKQIFSLRCFTPANETMAACYIFCPIQYNLSNLK